jgi:hypothetical protein
MIICDLKFLVVTRLERGGADVSKVGGQRLFDLGSRWCITSSLFILKAIRSEGDPSESQS